MANKKITDLTELTAAASDDYLEIVDTSANTSKKISRENLTGWHFLTTPLTSTAWNNPTFSTTAKTKIDLSAVFGVPAGVKAVMVKIRANDSASPSNIGLYAGVGANNVDSNFSVTARPAGLPSGYYSEASGICACDANGDIYFQCSASGTNTMQVRIQIFGYWL